MEWTVFRRQMGCHLHYKVIDTPLVEALGDRQAFHDALISRTALKRIGQPEEVRNVIIFLLSDQASYVTSTVSTLHERRHVFQRTDLRDRSST
jgi:NAD(P)-dependent dehydrogenase (short-subunit alcohol dehydrogenase family)